MYTFINKSTCCFCKYNVEKKEFIDLISINNAVWFSKDDLVYKIISMSLLDNNFLKNKNIQVVQFDLSKSKKIDLEKISKNLNLIS